MPRLMATLPARKERRSTMQNEGGSVLRWRLGWRSETFAKAAEMAQSLLRKDVDKDSFRTFLTACFEHRVVTPQDIIQNLKVDKSGPTRWTQEGSASAPNAPTRVMIIQLIEKLALERSDELNQQAQSVESESQTPPRKPRAETHTPRSR